MKGDTNDIYFTEALYYSDFTKDNLLLDISDVLTYDLSEFGDVGTVEDKMYPDQLSYLKRSNGAVYALPHYAAYQGIIYDKDLFDSEGFYLAANPTIDAATVKVNSCYSTDYDNGNDGFIISAQDKKSNGPDGLPNTSDDGLPATYDEYFALCDYMVLCGSTPVIWTGQYQQDYNKKTLQALYVDDEGKEQSMINVSFSGEKKNLISVSDDGTVTDLPNENITLENAYKLVKSEGYYYAYKFFERLVGNTQYYSQHCFNLSTSHMSAQTQFLLSRPLSATQGKPIGMLFEGMWWENEADASFKNIAERYGEQYSRTNRALGWMPFPKATKEKVGETSTLIDCNAAYGFVNSQTDKKDLAIKFLAFACTDQSLVEFTELTSTPKAFRYDMPEENLNKLSNFTKEMWALVDKSDLVFPYVQSSVFEMHKPTVFSLSTAKVGNTVISNPVLNMRSTRTTYYSAEQLFNGLQNYYTQSYWADKYL